MKVFRNGRAWTPASGTCVAGAKSVLSRSVTRSFEFGATTLLAMSGAATSCK